MFIFPPPSPRFFRENRGRASNSSLLQEAWQLRLIYAGVSPQCQEMHGWLFKIPVRMVATSCLVPAAKFFDRLPNLIDIRRFREELEICLEFVCGAAVFAVSPIDST